MHYDAAYSCSELPPKRSRPPERLSCVNTQNVNRAMNRENFRYPDVQSEREKTVINTNIFGILC